MSSCCKATDRRSRQLFGVASRAWPAAARDSAGPPLYGNRTAGWYAIGLLPNALDLLPDSFGTTYNSTGQPREECSERALLAATVSAFGVPRNLRNFTLVAALNPPQRDYSAIARGALGELFSLGGLQVQWDVASGVVRIHAAWDPAATVVATAATAGGSANWPAVVLSISRRADGALGVCINGSPAPITQRPLGTIPLTGGWLGGASLSSGWSLASADQVQLGDPRATISSKTRLHQLWFVTAAWSCADVATWMAANVSSSASAAPPPPPSPPPPPQGPPPPQAAAGVARLPVPPRLAAQAYPNTLPELVGLEVAVDGGGTGADGEAFVGQGVTVTARFEDAEGDTVRARLVAYGVPARGCAVAGCGDDTAETNGTGSVTLTYTTAFALPGRYVLRLFASDLTGLTRAWDVAMLVRKLGDTERRAACCRSTGMVIAGQNGRPIHSSRFRDPRVTSLAAGMGWPTAYLDSEDLEAERLFDWGVLAPQHDPTGLQLSPCMDAFLAGPGSPRVLAGSLEQRAVTTGHGKRLLVVPQGYDWAASLTNKSNAPSCNTHWTQWAADSPYRAVAGKLGDGTSLYCSYGCTRDGTRTLQQLAGMSDRLLEAMAELSFGRFSLSWDINVTDTLLLPQVTSPTDTFGYNDAPLGPFLRDVGLDRAAFHTVAVLAPLPPRSLNPGYTAWSAVGAATMFVMRCMPELYYLVHELGHLLGLPHADVWRVEDGTVAPSDPAGPGTVQDAYSDKLDMMACCRGDYGALARTWLGWMPYPERRHIPLSDTAGSAPNTSQPAQPPPPSPSSSSAPSYPASADTLEDTSAATDANDCVPSASPTGCTYTLWPVDRSESRGKLKALSVRLSGTQLVVLSYKSLPWWQDARLGRDAWDTWAADRDSLIPDEMRSPLTGLSAEYMRLVETTSSGTGQWTGRGLLDFNLFFGEWPSALPRAVGALPPAPAKSAFALLKEGQAWLHPGSGVLLVAQREVECEGQAELPVYNYSVPNFYGFRGETPGGESWRRADYSGYTAGLRCLQIAVRTQLPAGHKPGKLPVRLRVADTGADRPLDLRGSCGFPLLPRLQLILPTAPTGSASTASANRTGANSSVLPPGIAAVVWKDPMNVTFASETMTATLPPFSDGWVREASATDSTTCAYGCDPTYRIRIASYNGAQTLVSARVVEVSTRQLALYVLYRYYTLDEVTSESELLYVPVIPPWASATGASAAVPSPPPPAPSPAGAAANAKSTDPRVTAAWGLQLLGDAGGARRLDEQPAVTWSEQQMPLTGCSQQWSLTMLLQLSTPKARDGRWQLATLQLGSAGSTLTLAIVWNTTLGAAAPGSPAFTTRGSVDASSGGSSTAGGAPGLPVFALSVSLGSGREASVLMAPPPQSGTQLYHVAIVYDNGRLGAWVDGGGGWPWRDIACVPARPGVTYCARATVTDDAAASAGAASATTTPLQRVSMLGGGTSLDASLLSARLYNYALPRADFPAESACLQQQGTCAARFGLRASGSASISPPPPANPDNNRSGNGTDDASSGLQGWALRGPVAVAVPPGQAADWDWLRKAVELSVPPTAPPPPPTDGKATAPRYSLQVGSWSACSATCGGGVSLRPVLCFRSTARGPWPVGHDDCPLVGLVPATAACNQQACPARWAALAPVPGPDATCSAQLGATVSSAGDEQQRGATGTAVEVAGAAALLQPVCLQEGAWQVPLSACVGALPAVANSTTGSLMAASLLWDTITLTGLQPQGVGAQRDPSNSSSSSGNDTASGRMSLRQALLAGALQTSCTVTAGNASSSSALPESQLGTANVFVWRYGPWGPCNASCDTTGSGNAGGRAAMRSRAAECYSAVTGVKLEPAICEAALGPAPASRLSAPCGGQPCGIGAWQVDGWSACDTKGSVMSYGRMTRTVSCVDAATGNSIADSLCGSSKNATARTTNGTTVAAAGMNGWVPPTEAVCSVVTPLQGLCMVPVLSRSEQPCFGNGVCTYAGCVCRDGFSGPFCEVPLGTTPASGGPSGGCASGILDRRGDCCASGLLSANGTCCDGAAAGTAGAAGGLFLDGEGQCCQLPVDACGMCGGSGVAVDVQGTCCSTILDQYGVCCGSGLIDECGVCDGDGTSCVLRLQLRLQLSAATAAAPWWALLPQSAPTASPRPPSRPRAPPSPPAPPPMPQIATAAATGSPPVQGNSAQKVATSAAAPAVEDAAVGGGDDAAPVPVSLDATAESLLRRIVHMALGPVQGAVRLTLVSAAVESASAAAPPAPVAAQSSSTPAADAEALPWILITYDVLHRDADDAGAGPAPAPPPANSASKLPASNPWGVNGSSELDLGPLAPYNFTTGIVGLRLEGLRDALQVLGERAAIADSSSAAAWQLVPPWPSTFATPPTTPSDTTTRTAGSSGTDTLTTTATTASTEEVVLWQQQTDAEARPHADILQSLSTGVSALGPTRRRRVFAAVAAATHTTSSSALDHTSGLQWVRSAEYLRHPDDLDSASGNVGEPAGSGATPSPRRRLRHHHATPWARTLAARVLAARRRPQQRRRLAVQSNKATVASAAPPPPPPPSPAPQSLAASLAAVLGPDAPQDRRAAAQALLLSSDVRVAVSALGLQQLSLAGLQRLGSCGNGICEVGEQAGGLAVVEMGGAACPQDCPLALRACPAGSRSDALGAEGGGLAPLDLQPCGGRGACMLASGACACFEGYTGDACESCAPGFQRATYGAAAGVCVRQYIRGRTVLEWDALGDATVQSSGLLGNTIILACLVAGSAVIALLMLGSLVAWVRRAKGLPLLPWSKHVPARVPAPTVPAYQHSPSPSREKSRKRGSPARVAPTPTRGVPPHSPGGARTGAGAGGRAVDSPTVVRPEVHGVGAGTPVRRAVVRVIASGEDWQTDGLQVIPAPSLSPSPGSRTAQQLGRPRSSSADAASVSTLGVTPPPMSPRVALWNSAMRAAAAATAAAAAAVTPTRRQGPSASSRALLREESQPASTANAAQQLRSPEQQPAQPHARQVPPPPQAHSQQQQHGHPSTPQRRRRAAPLGEACEAKHAQGPEQERLPSVPHGVVAPRGWARSLRWLLPLMWPKAASPSTANQAQAEAEAGSHAAEAASAVTGVTGPCAAPRPNVGSMGPSHGSQAGRGQAASQGSNGTPRGTGGGKKAAAANMQVAATRAAAVGPHGSSGKQGATEAEGLLSPERGIQRDPTTPSPRRRAAASRLSQTGYAAPAAVDADGARESDLAPLWHADVAAPAVLQLSPEARASRDATLQTEPGAQCAQPAAVTDTGQRAATAPGQTALLPLPPLRPTPPTGSSSAGTVELTALAPHIQAPAAVASAGACDTGRTRTTSSTLSRLAIASPPGPSLSWRWWSPADTVSESGSAAEDAARLRLSVARRAVAADIDEDDDATPLLSSARDWSFADAVASSRDDVPTMADVYLAASAAASSGGRSRAGSTPSSSNYGAAASAAVAPGASASAQPPGPSQGHGSGGGSAMPLSPTNGLGATAASPRVAALRGHEAAGAGDAPSVVKSPRRALLQSRVHMPKKG